MVMLVLAGISAFAGVLAIAAGIPVKEFGVGSTLILAGVLSCCTCFMLVGMWAGFNDLQAAVLRRRPVENGLPPRLPDVPQAPPISQLVPPPMVRTEPPPRVVAPVIPPPPPAPPPPAETPIMMPPWQEAPSRERQALFGGASTEARVTRGMSLRSRIEREAAAMPEADILPSPFAPPDATPRKPSDEPRPVQQRGRGDAQRSPRAPAAVIEPRDPPILSTPIRDFPIGIAERDGAATSIVPDSAPSPIMARAPQRSEATMAVTVLKSGVVDGMAYWLYSDGSIEAQMPEGMMRFTSIEELRTHLDRRA